MTPERTPAWLQEVAAEAGPPVPAAANRPLALDDPARCWLGRGGRARRVFVAAWGDDGAPSGFRHVVRVPAGQLAFAAAPPGGAGGRLGLMAKGIAGTVVRQVPTGRLIEAVRHHHGRVVLAALVDAWIDAFAAIVAGDIVPRPRIEHRVAAGLVQTEAGERVAAERDVLWIEPAPGAAPAFLDIEHAGDDGLAPVTRDAWLTAVGGDAHRHRAPAVHDPQGGPDLRARGGAGGAVRHSRRAARSKRTVPPHGRTAARRGARRMNHVPPDACTGCPDAKIRSPDLAMRPAVIRPAPMAHMAQDGVAGGNVLYYSAP